MTSAYATTQLFGGPCASSSAPWGHIAGIVNPPNPKSRHWTNDAGPGGRTGAARWGRRARGHLVARLDRVAERAGERGAPPSFRGVDFPPVADASGTCVHERRPNVAGLDRAGPVR